MPSEIHRNYSELFVEPDTEETEDGAEETVKEEQDTAYNFIGNVTSVAEVTRYNFEQVLEQPILFFYNVLSFVKKTLQNERLRKWSERNKKSEIKSSV